MVVSSRAIVASSLALLGMALLAGPTLGQQQDGGVRKAATTGASATPAPPTPATFGTIDMSEVFKNYDKVKVTGEEFRAAVMARRNDLMKLMTEMQHESEELAKMTPNSLDYKKREDHITQLKAQSEAGREQAEREFNLKEAEMLATLYKEIQSMVARVAKWKKMTYVLRVSNEPVTGSDPNSAMRAIERTVVYADSANDITKEVIHYLNTEYKKAGGHSPAPKPAQTAGAGAAPTQR
jgi:outer membrane protein